MRRAFGSRLGDVEKRPAEGYVVDEGITSLAGMREAFKSNPLRRARSPKAALQTIREAPQGSLAFATSYSSVR